MEKQPLESKACTQLQQLHQVCTDNVVQKINGTNVFKYTVHFALAWCIQE